MLSKLRHVLDKKSLKSVYYSIFDSYLYYASFVWAKSTNSLKRLHLLQETPLKNNVFRVETPKQTPLLKTPKSLNAFKRLFLKTAFSLANL